MNELIIFEYQAKEIEDTLRILNNQFQSHKRETCLDRKIDKSLAFIREVLAKSTEPTP